LHTCPIFSSAVENIFPILLDFAERSGLDAYEPTAKTGYFRNLVLRESKSGGEILAVLVTKAGKKIDGAVLAQKLREKVPQVRSLWWVENERVSDLVDYTGKTHVDGESAIEERLRGLKFRIYPETFFQPNPQSAEVLYTRIEDEVRNVGARKVLGLYCGSGSIELSISRAAGEVVGIDSEIANITAARENASLNGIENCRFIEGRVERVLREEPWAGYDLLILDPPRAGISPKGLRQIIGLDIPNIIYVSCNPAAFARDLGFLGKYGYRLRKLGSYDFFPHTPHLESLGILAR